MCRYALVEVPDVAGDLPRVVGLPLKNPQPLKDRLLGLSCTSRLFSGGERETIKRQIPVYNNLLRRGK